MDLYKIKITTSIGTFETRSVFDFDNSQRIVSEMVKDTNDFVTIHKQNGDTITLPRELIQNSVIETVKFINICVE